MKSKKNVSREKKTKGVTDLEAIGRTFRIARQDQKLTILDVADKSGVSRVTISKVEKGQIGNCGIDTLSKIASVLKLDLSISVS